MDFKLQKEDLVLLDTILGYKKVGSAEVKVMVDFMRIHIDERISICDTCPTQIRFAHRKLRKWVNHNEVKINELRYGKQEDK